MCRRTCAAGVLLLAVLFGACVREGGEAAGAPPEPTVEVSPVERGEGRWQVATADTLKFTVTAPGADKVQLLYRPVVADSDRLVELRTVEAPSDRAGGKFTAEVNAPPDFEGEVWARAVYPGGASKETREIPLTTRTARGDGDRDAGATTQRDAASTDAAKPKANRDAAQSDAGQTPDSDESARSDKFTGGRVLKTALRPGDADISITVNVPAFKLTLWQGGKEVKTYPVGVGRKKFPIPSGSREAKQIIFNPAWIPPDSSWVRASSGVEPYERIPADDQRNPLGKIKIPLGDGYLIHEAAAPSDIGSLVSHGCVRMLTADIFDLSEKIIAARGLPVSEEEVERLRSSKERRAVRLDEPLTVDINYDTQVVEGGVLHVYPDVYDHGSNKPEDLRAELRGAGVDAARLDSQTLEKLLERASMSEAFVVKISDLKAGRALSAGRTEPLTEQPGEEKPEEGAKDEARRKPAPTGGGVPGARDELRPPGP